MQNIVALRPDAVNVIHNTRKFAAIKWAILLLHKFLEAIFGELLIFHVVRFVFFYKGEVEKKHMSDI